MQFDLSASVADEGVAAVGAMINRHFRWIFREIAKRDLGIDAQVEVCEGNRSTSRLLALQIKSGNSYFKERSQNGVIFRGSLKHLDYYLHHSLPVFVVLYDPLEEKAWWQHVRKDNVRRTREEWVMEIPYNHLLIDSRDELSRIATILSVEDRESLPRLKSFHNKCYDIAAMYQVLHAPRRSLTFINPFISNEFVAVMDFIAAKVSVRGIIGSDERTLSSASILPPTSRLDLRIRHNRSRMLHAKLMIVDNYAVCVGSANLVWTGSQQNLEVLECSTERSVVMRETTYFEQLWAEW